MDRRAFLAGTTGVAAGLLSGCATLAAVPVAVDGDRIRLRLSNHPPLSEPGGFLKIRPEGSAGVIFVLVEGGELIALSPVCTHRGCQVDLEGPRLVCPCHGSTYERTGRLVRGPAERGLTRYPVEVGSDGVLEIVLPDAGRERG